MLGAPREGSELSIVSRKRVKNIVSNWLLHVSTRGNWCIRQRATCVTTGHVVHPMCGDHRRRAKQQLSPHSTMIKTHYVRHQWAIPHGQANTRRSVVPWRALLLSRQMLHPRVGNHCNQGATCVTTRQLVYPVWASFVTKGPLV